MLPNRAKVKVGQRPAADGSRPAQPQASDPAYAKGARCRRDVKWPREESNLRTQFQFLGKLSLKLDFEP
jgi:hypothetical protein